MKKRSEFIGTELDWFAAGSDGFIALMSSAGYGPIPDRVFERFDAQRRIEEFLSSLIGQLLKNDWDRMILSLPASGIFVYDWKHWNGPYLRLGTPQVPHRMEELCVPPELRDGFAVVPEWFSASADLRPELVLTCTR